MGKYDLPYSNSCYYEMVDCDTTCNLYMRIKCKIREWFYRVFKNTKPPLKEDNSEKIEKYKEKIKKIIDKICLKCPFNQDNELFYCKIYKCKSCLIDESITDLLLKEKGE